MFQFLDSLSVTERSLSNKLIQLEPKVKELEERETVLVKRLKEKNEENKMMNAKWERIASEGLREITSAFCGQGDFRVCTP
eukprot:Seg5983.4 transcript_id=Seg5983.4/GoldUCD/mRNA.D3Y31 product="hypothetical protein" protein_id=Seg5983.4/GoldUCD/D3Y31